LKGESEFVSLVVVSKEYDADLEECLECTRHQTRAFDEIIVCISSDSEQARKRWPQVTFIAKPAGRSKARNIAWKASKGSIVCFWEADSIFNDEWLREVLNTFALGADAVIDRRRSYCPKGYFQRSWDRGLDLRYARYVPFSAWAFRRNVLVDTEGFDESLDYAEDTDLGLRLKAKGYKILLADKAVQWHKGEPRSPLSMMRRRFTFGYKKTLGFYRKHPDLFPTGTSLLTVLCLSGAAVLVVLGRLVLLALVAAVGFTVAFAVEARESWGILRLRHVPSLTAIRLSGAACYHIGAVLGLATRAFRRPSIPWPAKGRLAGG